MLHSIQINDAAYKKRVGKDWITFQKGLNVLIGPNGSGKSSTIVVLQMQPEGVLIKADKGPVWFHDSGKTKGAGSTGYIDSVFDVARIFSSRGEGLRTYIRALDKVQNDGSVICMDEPCTSLDINEVLDLRERLVKASKQHQIIVATHNPIIACIPAANVIEYKKGYLKYLKSTWLNELES